MEFANPMLTSSTVKVLDKALAIVAQLKDQTDECSMADLSRSVDMPISTVHRILATLERHGYVQRNPSTRGYTGGPQITPAPANTDLFREWADAALPAMAQLGRTTSETVMLSRLGPTRDKSLCIARVESPLPLRLELLPGTLTPLYVGAQQLVLLAFMDSLEIDGIIGGNLRKFTPKTVTDPVRLKRRLSRVRNEGYSRISEETTPDVGGISVPLFDRTGRVSLALGIAGPSRRLLAEPIQQYVAAIRSASSEIARRLGLCTWERGFRIQANAK